MPYCIYLRLFAIRRNYYFGKSALLIVAAFIVYLPAEGLGAVIPMIRLMEASLDRIDAVKDVPAMPEGKQMKELEHHDIEFRHVTFAYNQKRGNP